MQPTRMPAATIELGLVAKRILGLSWRERRPWTERESRIVEQQLTVDRVATLMLHAINDGFSGLAAVFAWQAAHEGRLLVAMLEK